MNLIAPVSAVAVKPGSGESGNQKNLHRLIQDHWRENHTGDRPAQFDFLLLTGGLRSINKTALLVFEKGDQQPGLVVKMPRVPESIPFLEREASNLQGVHANWGGHLPGVPRVHFYQAYPPFAALGEDALQGYSLQTRLTRENFSSLARLATDGITAVWRQPI
jgi:hypothetical protein